MTPYEILLSESQERMLVVAEPRAGGRGPGGLREVGARGDADRPRHRRRPLPRRARRPHRGGDSRASALVDDCPIYHPEAREADAAARPPAAPPPGARPAPTPTRRSRAPARHADHRQQAVGVRAVRLHRAGLHRRSAPAATPACFQVPGTTLRHRGHAWTATAGSWRSIPTRAARPPSPRRRATWPAPARVPLGITDCLNFGNPEKPEVFFQFREACRGIADACRAFDTPVTGGNVSLYNESPTGAIDPTPTVGMVGLLEPRRAGRCRSHFRATGDAIVVLGEHRRAPRRLGLLGRALRLRRRRSRRRWTSPRERALQRFLVAAARGAACSARRTTAREGGLAVALAEAAIGGPYAERGFGADVDLRRYAPDLTAVERCCSARTTGAWSSAAARRMPTRCWRSPREHGVRAVPGGRGAAPAAAAWTSGLPGSVHRWPVDRTPDRLFRRDSAAHARRSSRDATQEA